MGIRARGSVPCLKNTYRASKATRSRDRDSPTEKEPMTLEKDDLCVLVELMHHWFDRPGRI